MKELIGCQRVGGRVKLKLILHRTWNFGLDWELSQGNKSCGEFDLGSHRKWGDSRPTERVIVLSAWLQSMWSVTRYRIAVTGLNRVKTALNMWLFLAATRTSVSQTRSASFIALLSSMPAWYPNWHWKRLKATDTARDGWTPMLTRVGSSCVQM